MWTHADETHLNDMMICVRQAQEYLKSQGVNQWQNGYPAENDLQKDIRNGYSYVYIEEGEVVALATLVEGIEPTYNTIEGKWITDGPYVTIHRIAIRNDKKGRGIGGSFVDYAAVLATQTGCKSIRIDTHCENISMQRMIQKNGFTYCGIITLLSGDLRNAYEKVL
ncbi:MAG: GNAT family N-acetyltransferase [Erysipelotrichaceae bacterium]|nr:GNAT family N-acetyltransferase [Erysipelotrichaceae bacterium]